MALHCTLLLPHPANRDGHINLDNVEWQRSGSHNTFTAEIRNREATLAALQSLADTGTAHHFNSLRSEDNKIRVGRYSGVLTLNGQVLLIEAKCLSEEHDLS